MPLTHFYLSIAATHCIGMLYYTWKLVKWPLFWHFLNTLYIVLVSVCMSCKWLNKLNKCNLFFATCEDANSPLEEEDKGYREASRQALVIATVLWEPAHIVSYVTSNALTAGILGSGVEFHSLCMIWEGHGLKWLVTRSIMYVYQSSLCLFGATKLRKRLYMEMLHQSGRITCSCLCW